MVGRVPVEKTMTTNVPVRGFPSLQYSSNENGGQEVLDDRFVMGTMTNPAAVVLRRRRAEHKKKHLGSFSWLVSPPNKKAPVRMPSSSSSLENNDNVAVLGCRSELIKSTDLVKWVVRRKVKYFGRHHETPPRPLSSSSDVREIVVLPSTSSSTDGARKRGEKRPACEKYRPTVPELKKKKAAKMENSKDRWSKERYESAEVKLMDIMREKGAVLGNPILRPELRAEARKHIGDTGLLDHLLKHMAGKVLADRNERFRRRHNPEGAMEYWLEEADLIEMRRRAGVQDPFWIPPPGWNPGDGSGALLLDPASAAMALKQLKEEMANMKRSSSEEKERFVEQMADMKRWSDMEVKRIKEQMAEMKSSSAMEMQQIKDEMAKLKRDFERILWRKQNIENEVISTSTSIQASQLDTDMVFSFQEKTYNLMKRKQQLEQQLNKIWGSLNALQGEVSHMHMEETNKLQEMKKKAVEKVRSSFRICKPQGTFLWPNCGYNNSSSSSSNMMQVEDILGVPTPTSASSATSPLFHLPSASSPVKARPKVRTVSVSCVDGSAPPESQNCTGSPRNLFVEHGNKLPQLLISSGGVLGTGGISSSNMTSTTVATGQQGDHAAVVPSKGWLALGSPPIYEG